MLDNFSGQIKRRMKYDNVSFSSSIESFARHVAQFLERTSMKSYESAEHASALAPNFGKFQRVQLWHQIFLQIRIFQNTINKVESPWRIVSRAE